MRPWTLALLLLCAPVTGWAAGLGGALEALDHADRLAQGLDFPAALRVYERVLLEPQLSRGLLARAYEGVALNCAILGQRERATWAFMRLMMLRPGWRLPPEQPPKVREPYASALAFWAERSAPALAFPAALAGPSGQGIAVPVRLSSDPLAVVRGIRLAWRQGGGAELGRSFAELGQHPVLPATAQRLPGLELQAQAVDAHGSVLVESSWAAATFLSRTLPPPRVDASPAAFGPANSAPAAPRPDATPGLGVYAAGFVHLAYRGVGGEAGLSYRFSSGWGAVASAVLGAHLGGQLGVTWYPLGTGARLSPFAQLRGTLTPLPNGLAESASLWLGAGLALGPGRVIAGPAGELSVVPTPFRAYGVFFMAGYAFR